MAHSYRLRIDGEFDDKMVKFLKERTERWLLVHHVVSGENPHYHAYVETKYSANNFPKYIKQDLGVSGNGGYSNKKCDVDRKIEFCSYMFNTKKGNVPRLVSYDGFSPLDVETFREHAQRIANEFATRVKEEKKLTKFDIAERVMTRLDEGGSTTTSDVYDAVVDLLIKNRMCTGIFVIKDIMATVLALRGDSDLKRIVLRNFNVDH